MNSMILRVGAIHLAFVTTSFALLPSAAVACDTWVALPDVTQGEITILAKNSDRPNFDCQPLFLYPRRPWPEGAEIDLGRLRIPQVSETFATLGSSPYWCWGYEEGINEYGVAIGNEGIRTRPFVELVSLEGSGQDPEQGPTGMDLIRLALERSRTAQEALEILTDLLEKYGQFGSGIPGAAVSVGGYDNSYIIADAKEAWVLETAGRRWVARRHLSGSTSISNTTTVGTDWSLASPDLLQHAITAGYWKSGEEPFDFTKAYGDASPGGVAQRRLSEPRAACSSRLLLEKAGQVTPRWMMTIARDRSSTPSIDRDNTASSCVAVLPKAAESLPVFWWCPATPSNSCYIPFFVHGKALPEVVTRAGTLGKVIVPPSTIGEDGFSPESYWWLFRDLCDQVRVSYKARNRVVRAAFDPLERDFEAGLGRVMKTASLQHRAGNFDAASEILDAYSRSCLDRVLVALEELRQRFDAEVVEVPEEFRPLVGKYVANFGAFQNAEFTVLVQNDRLALDIPGQRIFELRAPDEEGKRFFVLTDQVAVRFRQEGDEPATAMDLFQAGVTLALPRAEKEEPASVLSRDFDEEKEAVSAVLSELHTAKLEGNGERFFSLFADEAIVFGTAADERWSLDEYKHCVSSVFSSGRKRPFTIFESNVFVSKRGQVAWFDERQERPGMGELRDSGVLQKIEGTWKVVQYALSIPVPNELARELHEATSKGDRSNEGAPLVADEKESRENRAVRELLNTYHRAAANADGDAFFECLDPDGVFCGTDKTERWTREELRAFVGPYFARGQGWTATPVDQNVFLSEDGNTAWFDELLRNATYADTRATGVMEKSDGKWKIVHINVSFPIPNDLLETFIPKILEMKTG